MAEPQNIPVYDPAGTSPILAGATTPAQPFSVTKLLNDPNFQNLLAGIGARLDPQGVGGALGNATIAYNQATAAQKVGAKTIANNERTLRAYEKVATRLGGMTPPGIEGATSLRVNKDGSYTATGNVADEPSDQQSQLDDMIAPYAGRNNSVESPQAIPQSNITQSGAAAPSDITPTTPNVADDVAELISPFAQGAQKRIATPSAPVTQASSTTQNAPVTLIAQKNNASNIGAAASQNTPTRNNGANPQGAFSLDLAERKRVIDGAIEELAPSAGVRPQVIRGIISVENAQYQPATNNRQFGIAGGQGLMQVIPSTWARYAPKDSDPSDPTLNLLVGIAHYKELLDYYGGDELRAAAAYHSGPGNIPKVGAIPERVQQRAPDGRTFTQFPLRYAQRVLGVAETLPAIPVANTRTETSAPAVDANVTSDSPEQQPFLARVAQAQSAQAISQTSSLRNEVSALIDTKVFASISADDLRGLSPEQVDRVVKNELLSQKLANDVAELTGRNIAATRKELAQSANTISTLKIHAAREIAASNLPPAQQEQALTLLGRVSTLSDARDIAVATASLPKLVHSGEERDAISAEKYNGRNYSQLSSSEKSNVNELLASSKQTFTIVANDAGLFRVNAKSGEVWQIDPSAPGGAKLITPGTRGATAPNAPAVSAITPAQPAQAQSNVAAPSANIPATSSAATPPTQSNDASALTPYEQLSPFAKSVSAPDTTKAFGAKSPSEGENRAHNYGTRALQAHEIVTALEKRDPSSAANFKLYIAQKLDELGEWSPFKLGASTSGIGTATGVAAGITGKAASIAGLPVGNVIYTLGRGAAVGAAKGTLVGAGVGVLAASTVILAPPVASLMRNEQEKLYMQSKLDFMSANLRKESGTAISVGEFLSEDKRFFPQLNDTPAVIAQKERARETAIIALQQESGRKLNAPRLAPLPPVAPNTNAPDVTSGMIQLGTSRVSEALDIPASPARVVEAGTVNPEAQARQSAVIQLNSLKSRQITAGMGDSYITTLGDDVGHPALKKAGVNNYAVRVAISRRASKLRSNVQE